MQKTSNKKFNLTKTTVYKLNITISDLVYAEKVSATPEDSPVVSCEHNPCQNKGVCTPLDDQFYCQCAGNWRGKLYNLEPTTYNL